jgi:hypothetical protein
MIRYIILLSSTFIISCSANFYHYTNNYRFSSKSGVPDYGDLNYWAAHPWKWDPSDSIPEALLNQIRDTIADIFFLHPTTYTSGTMFGRQNASIDDKTLNAKTDYTTILYQASVFNQHCRVFAPRYRQAHISSFFIQDTVKANESFDLAYDDLKTAFEYYLQHWNKGRPIIIASHSQGSKHAERLLKEFFENTKLKEQLIVAYIIGWGVPADYFRQIMPCNDSLQTGCVCSWRTLRKGYIPSYIKNEKEPAIVTNPLTWETNNTYASEKLHRGSILKDFNKIHLHTTDAQISNGVLGVSRPDFPGSAFYLSRNYHIGDINLFYINLRDNIESRIKSFVIK